MSRTHKWRSVFFFSDCELPLKFQVKEYPWISYVGAPLPPLPSPICIPPPTETTFDINKVYTWLCMKLGGIMNLKQKEIIRFLKSCFLGW